MLAGIQLHVLHSIDVADVSTTQQHNCISMLLHTCDMHDNLHLNGLRCLFAGKADGGRGGQAKSLCNEGRRAADAAATSARAAAQAADALWWQGAAAAASVHAAVVQTESAVQQACGVVVRMRDGTGATTRGVTAHVAAAADAAEAAGRHAQAASGAVDAAQRANATAMAMAAAGDAEKAAAAAHGKRAPKKLSSKHDPKRQQLTTS